MGATMGAIAMSRSATQQGVVASTAWNPGSRSTPTLTPRELGFAGQAMFSARTLLVPF
jgi:hypothetical protein